MPTHRYTDTHRPGKITQRQSGASKHQLHQLHTDTHGRQRARGTVPEGREAGSPTVLQPHFCGPPRGQKHSVRVWVGAGRLGQRLQIGPQAQALLSLQQFPDPSGATPPTSPQRYFRNFEEWWLGSLCPLSELVAGGPTIPRLLAACAGRCGAPDQPPTHQHSLLLLPAPPAAPLLHQGDWWAVLC